MTQPPSYPAAEDGGKSRRLAEEPWSGHLVAWKVGDFDKPALAHGVGSRIGQERLDQRGRIPL